MAKRGYAAVFASDDDDDGSGSEAASEAMPTMMVPQDEVREAPCGPGVQLPKAAWTEMISDAFVVKFDVLGKQTKPFALASGCSGTNSPTIALKVPYLVPFAHARKCGKLG